VLNSDLIKEGTVTIIEDNRLCSGTLRGSYYHSSLRNPGARGYATRSRGVSAAMILMADEDISKMDVIHAIDARATFFLKNICHVVTVTYPMLPTGIVQDTVLEHTIEKQWNESRMIETLAKIEGELKEAKGNCYGLVERMTYRGESLQDLASKTEVLSEFSALFRMQGGLPTLTFDTFLTVPRLKLRTILGVAALCNATNAKRREIL
jgi:hypothetical protein